MLFMATNLLLLLQLSVRGAIEFVQNVSGEAREVDAKIFE